MNKLFTIGEMAKLFGINAKTLRYYDEIGLIRPEHTDPMTGYRYYSTGQFERLNTIKYLRALDMPLAKIMRFFENKDIGQMILSASWNGRHNWRPPCFWVRWACPFQ